ncbi:Methionine--tRNA ligase [Candidatus Cyrtobacter comes]|uniref:Methionine--tRNA ligase n=1 Tax=Candidatus Cyrtobacter comes TaxID=675776 RepID=A0ABU5L8W8_9RICK|nr:methionine--tRNA ligase [Candidatus Cyrtobacter comes]MDZ5762572.1 Methionine--tRNA ligase [Candidatus Cyrtobacter comes]
MKRRFYISTPIYYVNDKPHIGHAYTSIASDIIARSKALSGFDVHFLTGTDEHGQKIEKAAKDTNINEFVSNLSSKFASLCKLANISNTDFVRTTSEKHKSFVQSVWRKISDAGYIYLAKYSGWYSIRDEAFYQEDDLINGKAPSGADVEWIEEESYFFKLSAFQDKLLELYEKNPTFILPAARRAETISFVKSGLKDLSISRTTFKWGIPVPDHEEHVIYVWFDALFNYLSYQNGFWPCDLHIVGKDILRFHTVFWPAFLMAGDFELPKRVFAHGWWTNEGEKISKSLGNVIDPIKEIEKFGLDYFRYYLIRAMQFGKDGDFSQNILISLVNAELANNIGNLVQRVTSFVYKTNNGVVPTPETLTKEEVNLLDKAYDEVSCVIQSIDNQELHSAIEHIVSLGKIANLYIDKSAPWKLKNTDIKRMNTILYTLLELIKVIGILLQPFIPDSAAKILDILQVQNRKFSAVSEKLKPGTQILLPEPIFKKIEPITKN